jgi:hypothetical protein
MSIKDSSNDEPRPTAATKKTYEKPVFRYEQVFVTSALTCTKTTNEGTCMLGAHTSAS